MLRCHVGGAKERALPTDSGTERKRTTIIRRRIVCQTIGDATMNDKHLLDWPGESFHGYRGACEIKKLALDVESEVRDGNRVEVDVLRNEGTIAVIVFPMRARATDVLGGFSEFDPTS